MVELCTLPSIIPRFLVVVPTFSLRNQPSPTVPLCAVVALSPVQQEAQLRFAIRDRASAFLQERVSLVRTVGLCCGIAILRLI